MFLYTWYGTTYWTAKSVVSSNSVYETKTISGDLIINEKKMNNNKKGVHTVECTAVWRRMCNRFVDGFRCNWFAFVWGLGF